MAAVQRREHRHSLCDFVFCGAEIRSDAFALILDGSILILCECGAEKKLFQLLSFSCFLRCALAIDEGFHLRAHFLSVKCLVI